MNESKVGKKYIVSGWFGWPVALFYYEKPAICLEEYENGTLIFAVHLIKNHRWRWMIKPSYRFNQIKEQGENQ